jgi:hypothetical protein
MNDHLLSHQINGRKIYSLQAYSLETDILLCMNLLYIKVFPQIIRKKCTLALRAHFVHYSQASGSEICTSFQD